MSIVQPELPEARVLDLFAGSGALGLEALSRGARDAVFVELAARSITALKNNIHLVGADAEASVHRGDALKFAEGLAANEFDIAFADPPYRLGLALQLAEQWLKTPFARLLGIEHEKAARLPVPGDRRAYGDTVVTFYRAE